jgi:hypothetical protein
MSWGGGGSDEGNYKITYQHFTLDWIQATSMGQTLNYVHLYTAVQHCELTSSYDLYAKKLPCELNLSYDANVNILTILMAVHKHNTPSVWIKALSSVVVCQCIENLTLRNNGASAFLNCKHLIILMYKFLPVIVLETFVFFFWPLSELAICFRLLLKI